MSSVLTYSILFLVLIPIEFIWPLCQASQNRKDRWAPNLILTFLNVIILTLLYPFFLSLLFLLSESLPNLKMNLISSLPANLQLLASFLLISFFSWLSHLLMHKLPWFWKIHQVHHSDQVVDITTTARFHPVELFLNMALIVFPSLIVFGIQGELFILYAGFDRLFNLFIHANIRLPKYVVNCLSYIFITPQVHQMHHSVQTNHHNYNFGTNFSIWDRLFSTYLPNQQTIEHFGIPNTTQNQANNLVWLLSLPVKPSVR